MDPYDYLKNLNSDSLEQEELDTPTTIDEEEATVGTESYSYSNKDVVGTKPKMTYMGNAAEDKANPGTKLHIRTADNIVFRVYLCANTLLDSPYFQNRLCLFLDGLNSNQIVIIEMGSGIGGSTPDPQLGMIISSIRNCKAKVVTIAAGRCGFGESCLFIYGKEKIISPYGALFFNGLQAYSEMLPMYIPYFKQIFDDALSEQVIDESTHEVLTKTGKFVMITHDKTIVK